MTVIVCEDAGWLLACLYSRACLNGRVLVCVCAYVCIHMDGCVCKYTYACLCVLISSSEINVDTLHIIGMCFFVKL